MKGPLKFFVIVLIVELSSTCVSLWVENEALSSIAELVDTSLQPVFIYGIICLSALTGAKRQSWTSSKALKFATIQTGLALGIVWESIMYLRFLRKLGSLRANPYDYGYEPGIVLGTGMYFVAFSLLFLASAIGTNSLSVLKEDAHKNYFLVYLFYGVLGSGLIVIMLHI